MVTANATEMRNKFGRYLERILVEPVVIEKTGRQVAVLISMEEYNRLRKLEDAYWGELALAAQKEERAGREDVERLLERAMNVDA
ncbi:MAG: type II toxin-antitoxin system Phd/YefM family antitoxin [Deltaproteobacteria bacterium]|jgi:prevent-host-death family protein|nr:type II toxin-antitoxin system Phd/YefM family antitoxin [Deltaproteobacteria bacterium]